MKGITEKAGCQRGARGMLFLFSRVSGASALSTPSQQLPLSEVEDTRLGFNFDVSRRVGRHTLGTQLSFSTESDYDSFGISIRDGIELNQR